jgi:uncharacterized protein (TIGR02996 family)
MTHAGFLVAILAEPERDDIRLIYADWLDEHGDPDRAAFIRVQCAIGVDPFAHNPPPFNPHCACNLCTLRRRERELLKQNPVWYVLPPGGPIVTELRRGFVAEVTLPCDQWMRHGPALVRAAPLERVGLSDRAPLLIVSGSWVWLRQGDAPEATHTLPDDLAYAMNAAERRAGWDSEAAARKALSVACLKWARNPAPAIH